METLKNLINGFWQWYNRHLFINTLFTFVLLSLQLIHLYWLTANVVSIKMFGANFLPVGQIAQTLIVFVDYLEIPEIITTNIFYFNKSLQKLWPNILFIFFINLQLLHLFWITDEFVLGVLQEYQISMPEAIVWVAIIIDYLEIPIIVNLAISMLRFVKRS